MWDWPTGLDFRLKHLNNFLQYVNGHYELLNFGFWTL